MDRREDQPVQNLNQQELEEVCCPDKGAAPRGALGVLGQAIGGRSLCDSKAEGKLE